LRRGRHGILYVKNNKFRKLSGYESMLLQGFPLQYAILAKEKIPNGKLLQQTGNAMTVTVIEAITKKLLEAIGYDNVKQQRAS
jgi:DNA (cytosine-5)-methyltransferase 1